MSMGFDIGDALAKLQDWLAFLDEKERELTGNLQRMSGKEDSDALMPADGDALMPADGDLPVEGESEDPWDL